MFALLMGAAATANASSLSLELGANNSGGGDAYLSLDVSPEGGPHFMASVGGAQSDTMDSTSGSLGLGSDPARPFFVTASVDYWGNNTLLETRTMALELGVQSTHWALMLTPRRQEHRLYTSGLVSRVRPYVDIESNGVRVSLDYYGEVWHLGAAHNTNNYDRNVSALASSRALQLVFSPTTLSLASGLEDQRGEITADYALRDEDEFGVQFTRVTSAVDTSILTAVDMHWRHDFSEVWSATLRAGVQHLDDGSDNIRFGSAMLAYRWE